MSLQPICILCLSVCDRTGSLSSCQHFFCARCVARLPPPATHPCPFCHKPFKLVKLNAPPLQSLFQDTNSLLSQTCKIIGSQLMHHQQIAIRMREALKVLNAKYQASEKKVSELTSALEAERKELHMLRRVAEEQKHEMTVMRKELELKQISTSEQHKQTPSMHSYGAHERNTVSYDRTTNNHDVINSNYDHNVHPASEPSYTYESHVPRHIDISNNNSNSNHTSLNDQSAMTRECSHTGNQVVHGNAILHMPSAAAHVMYSSAPPSPLHTRHYSSHAGNNTSSNNSNNNINNNIHSCNSNKYTNVERTASDVHRSEQEMHRSIESVHSTTHSVQSSRPAQLHSSAERLRALTPLGWSATSEIMKRHRSEEGPSQLHQHEQQEHPREWYEQEEQQVHRGINEDINYSSTNNNSKNNHNIHSSSHNATEPRNVPSTPVSQSFALHQLHSRSSSGKSSKQDMASTNTTTFRLSTPLVNALQPSQGVPHVNNTLLSPYGSMSTNALHSLGMPKTLQNLLAARQNSLPLRQGNSNTNKNK